MKAYFKLLFLLTLMFGAFSLSAQETTEVRIAWWGGNDTRHEQTIKVIELYESLNPNIDIVYEFYGWGDYWRTLDEYIESGQLPDIIQQDVGRILGWVERDLLLSLDPWIEDQTINSDYISNSVLASGVINGNLYGVSLGSNSAVFVLDVDAFNAAGVPLPPLDWTWADFEIISTQLHEQLGIYALSHDISVSEFWKTLYMSCCGQWAYNVDGTALGYNDSQPLVDFFTMLLRLQELGALESRAEYKANARQSVDEELIITGEAAIGQFWSNQIITVWEAAGEDRNFALYPTPRVQNGQSANYIRPSMFFAVTHDTDVPDEAAAFIDFFVNSVEANEILQAERGIPISSEVRNALLPQLDIAQSELFNHISVIEMDSNFVVSPDPAKHRDVLNSVYNPMFRDLVLSGLLTPEQGAKILYEEANRILADS